MTTPTPDPSAPDILKQDADQLARYFDQLLQTYPDAPPRLIESIRYSLLAGGKCLRPSLVLQTYQACCTPETRNPKPETPDPRPQTLDPLYPSALAAAAAIELIHTFSLVHDDLPAMDNDDLRRGRPTNHKVFGEATAILAGDAMITIAFQLLAKSAAPHLAPTLIAELAAATGPEGMIGGQILDMDAEHKSLPLPDLQHLHRLKTGALLTAACRLGAIAAQAPGPTLAAITRFGQHLGLAFQIVDDILDVTSTSQHLGKATNKDAQKGKNTYPTLLGLHQSRIQAASHLQTALDALIPLGPSATPLRTLAHFVVERQV